MSISEHNRCQLDLLRDIYEVSTACATKSYIWGGLTIDILEGRYLRKHGGIDAFTTNLLEVLDELAVLYEKRGYRTEFLDAFHMLEIRKGDHHASFNRLETDGEVAMWRHIGEQGTVYFPFRWLDDAPRAFYDASVYTSGVKFEFAIKTNVRLLSPEWQLREKDRDAVQYLERIIKKEGISTEDIYKCIWSYNPYWIKKGYEEYAMPMVAWPLLPR